MRFTSSLEAVAVSVKKARFKIKRHYFPLRKELACLWRGE
jgi:hypothetical protein